LLYDQDQLLAPAYETTVRVVGTMSLAETGAKSALDWRFGTEAEYVSSMSGMSLSLVGEFARVILELTVTLQIRHFSRQYSTHGEIL
jgi:hypothetical protein